MKKSHYVSKIEDKSLIKITKLNKNLNIIKNLKQMKILIRNYFDTEKIHAQTIFINEKVKIFNFFLEEFAFFEISIEFSISEMLNNKL